MGIAAGWRIKHPRTRTTGTGSGGLPPDSGGQWWGAWIENMTTGVDTYIGSIPVDASYTLATGVANFVEYFGAAVPCNKVPVSRP